jgi:hypothetical protein
VLYADRWRYSFRLSGILYHCSRPERHSKQPEPLTTIPSRAEVKPFVSAKLEVEKMSKNNGIRSAAKKREISHERRLRRVMPMRIYAESILEPR